MTRPKTIAAALLILFALPARADVGVIKGGDRMDDSTFIGVSIPALGGEAMITFICDSGRPAPRVMFLGKRFLGGKYFELAYRVDKKKMRSFGFYTYPDNSSGQLYTTYGDGGRSEDTKRVLRNLFMQKEGVAEFMGDFIAGASAWVRVWDYSRRTYDYDFNLVGLAARMDVLRDCYPPPK